jgi:predicted RND superfamily exporter protein
MYFTTNETIGGMFDTRPVAFISIYVEPTTDPNLNQSIHSFFENTKDESSYHILSSTLINLTNQILQAYQVAFYDYSNEKSTKMLEVWLVKDGYRYLLVYGSEPGRFDTYLHFAQKMIDSLGDKQYFRPAPTTNESINGD